MHEIQNTTTEQLTKMIAMTGREFGIRKSSYKKLLHAGQITKEEFTKINNTMDGVYFLLKELYSNSNSSKNLQVY